MREAIEKIGYVISTWGELLELILNGASVLFIFVGMIVSLKDAIQYRRQFPGDHPFHTNFRIVFGGWLVVALEFQLAADIVGTTISPTPGHLIELGAIAIIRTFLNYFLNKELLEQREKTLLHSAETRVDTSLTNPEAKTANEG